MDLSFNAKMLFFAFPCTLSTSSPVPLPWIPTTQGVQATEKVSDPPADPLQDTAGKENATAAETEGMKNFHPPPPPLHARTHMHARTHTSCPTVAAYTVRADLCPCTNINASSLCTHRSGVIAHSMNQWDFSPNDRRTSDTSDFSVCPLL